MLLTCTCGTKNRIPSLPTVRVRCGKCQHVFSPAELVKAIPELPPERPSMEDLLGDEDDFDDESY